MNDSLKERLLLDFIREDLDLTGAKNGCSIGACGSCTVVVDGKAVKSCRTTLGEVVGKSILTIEGLSCSAGFQPADGSVSSVPKDAGRMPALHNTLAGADGSLHPLQQAFVDHGAIQCGFCTPGMVMAAHAFLLKHKNPTREEIRKAIFTNLCRCTGYQQIVDAIQAAAMHY